MDRINPDASMDGLPMNTVLDTQPADRPLHDKAVNDGPTTANGPLADRPETLADRQIVAQFATAGAAEAAEAALLQAGIAPDAIHIDHGSVLQSATKPADDTVLGRLREAILPDESKAAAHEAVANNRVVLTVVPTKAQVEDAVRIIEAAGPTRFDADLERWRNKG